MLCRVCKYPTQTVHGYIARSWLAICAAYALRYVLLFDTWTSASIWYDLWNMDSKHPTLTKVSAICTPASMLPGLVDTAGCLSSMRPVQIAEIGLTVSR